MINNIQERLKGNILSKFKIVDKYFKQQKPANIEIHPSFKCGFSCTWCIDEWLKNVPSKNGLQICNDSESIMSKEMIDKIITGCIELGITGIIVSGGGNPTLCPSMPHLAEQANKNNIDIGMFVNGSNLFDRTIPIFIDNLTFIRFSVDSFDAENYAKTKGTTEKMYYRVLENIRKCTEYKKEHNSKCKIGIDFVITPENISLIKNIYEKSCELKIDYLQLADCVVTGYEFSKRTKKLILTELEKCYILNRKKDKEYIIEIIYEPAQVENITNCKDCLMKDYTFQIGASGFVHPCAHLARHNEMVYGNINDQSLKEIWENRPRQLHDFLYEYCRFREQNKILQGLRHIEHGELL